MPQLSANNSFTGNQSVTGNLSATGAVIGQTANFSANNSTQVVNVTQNGAGIGIVANGGGAGVYGTTNVPGGSGVYGAGNADFSLGVQGVGSTPTASGVGGFASGAKAVGVFGNWSGRSTIGQGQAQVGVWGDSSAGYGVVGSSDNNPGVAGISTNNAGISATSSNGYGLFGGSTNNWAVVGSSPIGGVFGVSQSIAGTYGTYVLGSSTGSGFTTIGAWGDTGVSGGLGVVGTTDDGNSFFGKNNTVNHETLYVENDSGFNGGTPLAARFAGPGASTYCYIPRDSKDDGSGDLICTGSKSAAVPVEGNRMVRLYAVEAADNWFEDAGSGQLANGSATIALDQVFAQTVNGDVDYHVFITPNGECEGLYVIHKSAQGFEVHELRGGHSNIAFDYRIMARRRGFENTRMQDVTEDFARMKRESDQLAARVEARKQEEKAHPKMEIPTLPKRSPLSSPHSVPRPVLPVTANRLIGSVK